MGEAQGYGGEGKKGIEVFKPEGARIGIGVTKEGWDFELLGALDSVGFEVEVAGWI